MCRRRTVPRVCVWFSLLVAACGGGDECELDAVSRDLGGAGLMDCRIASPDDTASVDSCAVAAHQGNNTFRAIYEREDGSLEALVHAPGGAYHLVRETPAGGIERLDCEGAIFVQEGSRSYVSCDDPSEPELVCD